MLDKTTGYDGELHAVIDGVHAKTDAIGMGTRMAQTVSGHPFVAFTCKVAEDGDVSMAIFEMQEKINAHIYRVRDKAGASDGALFAYWRKLPTIEVNNKGKMIVKARFLASYEVDDGSYSNDSKLKFNHETYTLDSLEAEPDVIEVMPTKEEIKEATLAAAILTKPLIAEANEKREAVPVDDDEPLADDEPEMTEQERLLEESFLLDAAGHTIAVDLEVRWTRSIVTEDGWSVVTLLSDGVRKQGSEDLVKSYDTKKEALKMFLKAAKKLRDEQPQTPTIIYWRIKPAFKNCINSGWIVRARLAFAWEQGDNDISNIPGPYGERQTVGQQKKAAEILNKPFGTDNSMTHEEAVESVSRDIPKLDIPKMMGAIEPELKPWGLTAHSQVMPQPLTIGQAIDGITDILKRIEGDDPDDQGMVLDIVGSIWRRQSRRTTS